MSEIIADVPEYPTTIYGDSSVPVVEEDGMGQFPEGGCERDE